MIRWAPLKKWKRLLRCFTSSVLEGLGDQNAGSPAGQEERQLVAMYCRCGRMDEARRVFDGVADRDVVCWTLMISGYGRQGRTKDAVGLLQQMALEGVKPDMVTLVTALNACCVGPAWLGTGKQIEAWILESGHELSAVPGTALVSMYAKCGSLGDAERTFEQMSQRNVVAWTVMLTASASQEQAVGAFRRMQMEGFKPNGFTLVGILRACATVGRAAADEEELRICSMIVDNGLESGNVIVATALINACSKRGRVAEARRVFDGIGMGERDVVAWNSMVAAYVEQGECGAGVELFQRMQLEGGVRPNRVTFTTLLGACCSSRLGLGRMIHAQAAESGLEKDVVVGTALVGMYNQCGRLDDAVRVFEGIDKHERDVQCWNAIISALIQGDRIAEAWSCYRQMKLEGVHPDRGTFATLLGSSGCSGSGSVDEEMLSEIAQTGLDCDPVVCNAIVNMHAKLGRLEDARRAFDGMRERDAVSWNAMLAAYVGSGGGGEKAIGLFRQMQQEGLAPNGITVATLFGAYAQCRGLEDACQELLGGMGRQEGAPSPAAWNLILTACAQQGRGRDALRLFRLMQQQGIEVDCVTLSAVISSCASLAALKDGKTIHSAVSAAAAADDPRVGNALVDMYAKCGSLADAFRTFSGMHERDVVSWTAIIAAYAQAGRVDEAMHLFRAMKLEGLTPDAITFITVLSLCSHAGLVEEGCRVFGSIATDHLCRPTPEHYSCVIDLLGRAGRVEEAEGFVRQMPFQANLLVWTALLSACTSQGDVERGRRAAEQVVRLDPECSSGYVALSNIFSSCHLAGNE